MACSSVTAYVPTVAVVVLLVVICLLCFSAMHFSTGFSKFSLVASSSNSVVLLSRRDAITICRCFLLISVHYFADSLLHHSLCSQFPYTVVLVSAATVLAIFCADSLIAEVLDGL